MTKYVEGQGIRLDSAYDMGAPLQLRVRAWMIFMEITARAPRGQVHRHKQQTSPLALPGLNGKHLRRTSVSIDDRGLQNDLKVPGLTKAGGKQSDR